jgi:hypothetical protein
MNSPKKKPAPVELVAGLFAVVTIDAFVFGNASLWARLTCRAQGQATGRNTRANIPAGESASHARFLRPFGSLPVATHHSWQQSPRPVR